jgi:hypothetical protein
MERYTTRFLGGLRMLGALVPIIAISLPAAAGQPAEPQDLAFKIVRQGEEVGRHRISFRREGGALRVHSELDIEVKVLAFTAFRYEQTRSEVWRGRQLVELASVANDDGTVYDIAGRAGPKGLRVTSRRSGKSWTLPPDSVPASYWNVSMVTANGRPLVDAQSGTILDAEVTKIGRERITVGGKDVVATRYRLGAEQPRDIWYDAQGRWVKMRAKGSDGSVAEWVLQ